MEPEQVAAFSRFLERVESVLTVVADGIPTPEGNSTDKNRIARLAEEAGQWQIKFKGGKSPSEKSKYAMVDIEQLMDASQ